ncbi:LysR family transcriptional regulator [Luteolibacter yonseiensis]|uniref:LysR family transcriptional regulator n=1 Tax=Luteolibacter yonseiensis TaxID=1144680 RepID=UPI002278445B|nr:LysR family transcriptional regulator [Luteolibacter yonseiensis]
MHLTQPALSRQVRDLEDELGVALFERGKNSVKLTDAGERFYEEAQDLLARAAAAVEKVRTEHREEVLRVGYAPSATAGILPRALERFHAAMPRVKVELADVSPPEMIRMAQSGQLDVVIALEPSVLASPGFKWSEFRQISLILIMRADHPLARRKRISPKLLCGLPLVGLGRKNFPDYVLSIRRSLKPLGCVPHFVALEEDGVPTLFASVEAYNAAAILADTVCEFLPRSLVGRPFHPKFDPVVAKVGICEARHSAHAELFVTILKQYAGKASAY